MGHAHSWTAGCLYVILGRSPAPPLLPRMQADCTFWSWSSRSVLRSTLLPYQQCQGGQDPRPLQAFHPVFPWAIYSTAVLDFLSIFFLDLSRGGLPDSLSCPKTLNIIQSGFIKVTLSCFWSKWTWGILVGTSRINDAINIIPLFAQASLCHQQPHFPCASCISFQGHMLVITGLWGVGIPCHYFFDSKTCLPSAKKEKRSQHGVYLFSKWKQRKINFALKWPESQVVSWNGDIWTLRNIALENYKICERNSYLGSSFVSSLQMCSFMQKNLISDFPPQSNPRLVEEKHTDLWFFCTLAFAGFHLPFLSYNPMSQLSFVKQKMPTQHLPLLASFFALSIKNVASKNLNSQCLRGTPRHTHQHMCTW